MTKAEASASAAPWQHFEKVIGLTANKFLELDKAQQEKFTSDGIELTGLEPAQAAKEVAQDAKGAA